MDITQDHLDAALRLAVDGNRGIGTQIRSSVPVASLATADVLFDEPGWPEKPGQLPLMSSMRLVIAASAVAIDLARVIGHLAEGGGILTSSALCRNVLENAATGTWIIRPGLNAPAPTDPHVLDEVQAAARRERIERAHITKWNSIRFYDAGQFKDSERRAASASWMEGLGDQARLTDSGDGRPELSELGSTVPAGLGRMTSKIEKETFGTKRKRPRLYDRLSAYGHPNLDATMEMESISGLFARNADSMVHEMWLALKLVAQSWKMLNAYAGWDVADAAAWWDEIDEIKVDELAGPWGG